MDGIVIFTSRVLWSGGFSLLPFMDVIRRSFVQAVSGRFCGLENYRVVLHNSAFLLAVKIRCGFFWYVCRCCWGFP